MTVFDASALLAFLQGENGADDIESRLGPDARCSAANWAEVAQKVRAAGADWSSARTLLMSYGLRIESVTVADAERAAALWARGSGFSLADRLCLALGERHGARIVTTDHAWSVRDDVDVIR